MSDKYPLLNTIDSPADLKQLKLEDLKQLCHEMRQYTIEIVEQTGGHLAPTLGVIELTIALHYIFDSPKDKIIWDVGHQAYAHKILTGRRDALKTIRQYGGISGFLKPSESDHDIFGAGHASTAISAGVGFAMGRDLKEENYQVVSIIGDGALTGGLAFEGLNNLGHLRTRMLVILNDNEMSISPNVGAISKYLNKMVTNPLYNQVRDEIWKMTGKLPVGRRAVRTGVRKLEESLKNLIVPGVIFDEMGLRYFGPLNGHDLPMLLETLNNIKDINTPVLLHVLTKKGYGYNEAEQDPVKFHGVGPSQKDTPGDSEEAPAYLKVFGDSLIRMADKDEKVVAVTAAMREGTGLVEFSDRFPERFFDVGIAEGHGVVFAAGLAAQGLRPFVAIYSTFLQRAFDMLVHDVAIQKLPVVFMLDRAGLVGQDGPTHHGVLDLSYLSAIPGAVIAAPRDGDELADLMQTANEHLDGPFFIRYPKASSSRFDAQREPQPLAIGIWEELKQGKQLAILCVGVMNEIVMNAEKHFKELNIDPTVINARFIKPFDSEILDGVLSDYEHVVIIEENVYTGGVGQRVQAYSREGEFAAKVHVISLPDRFVTHGTRGELLNEVGLTGEKIAATINDFLGRGKGA